DPDGCDRHEHGRDRGDDGRGWDARSQRGARARRHDLDHADDVPPPVSAKHQPMDRERRSQPRNRHVRVAAGVVQFCRFLSKSRSCLEARVRCQQRRTCGRFQSSRPATARSLRFLPRGLSEGQLIDRSDGHSDQGQDMMRKLVALGLTTIAMLMPTAAGAQSASDFYAGKTINILVAAGEGGAYSLYAQLTAEYLRKHFPGKPSIIVQNLPGAGGIRTPDYLQNVAPKDGTAIGMLLDLVAVTQML